MSSYPYLLKFPTLFSGTICDALSCVSPINRGFLQFVKYVLIFEALLFLFIHSWYFFDDEHNLSSLFTASV